jgi:hypothetical protein
MERPAPPEAAAWLRPCSDATWEVLDVAGTLKEALELELFWTLRKMDSFGAFRTRGGPFCRITVPWGSIGALRDTALGGVSFQAWKERLAAMLEVPADVTEHLRSKCYSCGKVGHLAGDCTEAAGVQPALLPAARAAAALAAHFVPVPKAVYFEAASGRSLQPRWRFKYWAGRANNRKVKRGHVTCDVDVDSIHYGALLAADMCDVAAKRRGRDGHTCPDSHTH